MFFVEHKTATVCFKVWETDCTWMSKNCIYRALKYVEWNKQYFKAGWEIIRYFPVSHQQFRSKRTSSAALCVDWGCRTQNKKKPVPVYFLKCSIMCLPRAAYDSIVYSPQKNGRATGEKSAHIVTNIEDLLWTCISHVGQLYRRSLYSKNSEKRILYAQSVVWPGPTVFETLLRT